MIDRVLRVLLYDLPIYLQQSDKKPIDTQIREMISLYRAYRHLPYQYIRHSMYLESFDSNFLDYLPPELVHRYRDASNPRDAWNLVFDKKRFFDVMNANNILSIPILFVISREGTVKSNEDNIV